MGGTCENGLDVSTGRSVYERCGNDCQIASLEKSIAERTRLRYADVDLLHQPRRQGIIQRAPLGTGKGQAAALRKNRESETALAMTATETAVEASGPSAEITSAIVAPPIIAAPAEARTDEEGERRSPIWIAVAIVRIRIWRVGPIVWRRSRRFGCVGSGRG